MTETIKQFFWRLRNKNRRKTLRRIVVEEPMIGDLILKRKIFTSKSTIGDLIIDGEFFCHSLEDTSRRGEEKVYGKTCIPQGNYEVVLNYSNKFKKFLPLLMNVPKFTGIRIHAGNHDQHTMGCILLGNYNPKHPDFISSSRSSMEKFMPVLEKKMHEKKVYIDISGGYSQAQILGQVTI